MGEGERSSTTCTIVGGSSLRVVRLDVGRAECARIDQ